jgi:hypothetical protein
LATQNIYVAPDNTFKLQLNMDPLQPGETSVPAPLPARPLSRGEARMPISPEPPRG